MAVLLAAVLLVLGLGVLNGRNDLNKEQQKYCDYLNSLHRSALKDPNCP